MGAALSKIGKVVKKLDPGRGGDVVLERVGLPTGTGQGANNVLDMGAAAAQDAADQAARDRQAAMQQQEELNRQQAQQTALLNEMNRNMAQDLKAENRSQVIAGGSAAAVDQTAEDLRKRRAGNGLSATLGINT